MRQGKLLGQEFRGRGWKLAGLSFVALLCVVLGMTLSSNLDLHRRSVAQTPTNIQETGAYPVVDRNGTSESPFVAVVDSVQNAVVNISARSRGQDVPWWFYGSDYASSFGSGFFFREDGYILTNAHVVKNAQELTVRTASGYEYPAEVVGVDPSTDLAVIKVKPEEDITVIPFGDSEALKVGDWAIAIGNPFPQQGLDRTVTVGVISAKGRSNLQFGRETPQYQDYIQTDASINPGNSGGPLLNLRGEAIGVNAAISSPTGSSVGIGFAIPINLARSIVPDLIASGKVSRGWLGVWLANVTVKEARSQGLSTVRGVKIDSVFANSPAQRAGIREGDLIVTFNDQEVLNAGQFSVLVSTVRIGSTVPIELLRAGKRIKVNAVVADRETYQVASTRTYQPPAGRNDLSEQEWIGMEFVTFTPAIAQDLGIRWVEGVYVTKVYPGTPADRASITEGTIIMQVNNSEVESAGDVARIARQVGNNGGKIPLIVIEPGGSMARKVVRI